MLRNLVKSLLFFVTTCKCEQIFAVPNEVGPQLFQFTKGETKSKVKCRGSCAHSDQVCCMPLLG